MASHPSQLPDPTQLPDPPQPTRYLDRKIDIANFSASDWYEDPSTTIEDALMTILLYTFGKPCAHLAGGSVMVPPEDFFTSAVNCTVVIMLRGTEGDTKVSHDTFKRGEMRIQREASGNITFSTTKSVMGTRKPQARRVIGPLGLEFGGNVYSGEETTPRPGFDPKYLAREMLRSLQKLEKVGFDHDGKEEEGAA